MYHSIYATVHQEVQTVSPKTVDITVTHWWRTHLINCCNVTTSLWLQKETYLQLGYTRDHVLVIKQDKKQYKLFNKIDVRTVCSVKSAVQLEKEVTQVLAQMQFDCDCLYNENVLSYIFNCSRSQLHITLTNPSNSFQFTENVHLFT